jgi:hypothetical protein
VADLTYKVGFGSNPLLATCGREVLAAILRPGDAGANNADDHLEVFEAALEQAPACGAGGHPAAGPRRRVALLVDTVNRRSLRPTAAG